jgi:hypothetical protein
MGATVVEGGIVGEDEVVVVSPPAGGVALQLTISSTSTLSGAARHRGFVMGRQDGGGRRRPQGPKASSNQMSALW